MKTLAVPTILFALFAASSGHAQSVVVSQGGSRPSIKGPEANFTGSVTIDPLYSNNEQTSNTGSHVTFDPGARSAWHTHPAGQILIITTGTGWFQEEGGEKRIIRPGDVIWSSPGVKHWHGATATTGVGHIAITNMKDGKNVTWMEKVSDQQYVE